MALTRSTARRYAEACFQIAERDGSMDAWLAALAIVEDRVAPADVTHLLSNPAIPLSARLDVLDRVLAKDVVGAPRSLVALLVRRNRVDLVAAVCREFRRLHALREGVVEAAVTSAAPLGADQREALGERLAAATGRRIEMSVGVDPTLLGGIQVRLGDLLIDGSVRGRLERLRARFTSTAI